VGFRSRVWVCLLVVVLCGRVGSAQSGTPVPSKGSGTYPPEVQRALTLEREGKTAEAAGAWRAVVKAEPRNGQAYAHLGLLEARQEHYAEAIAAYRKALVLEPGIPQLRLNLGLALFKSGDFKDAAAIFEEELRQHPKGPETVRLTMLAGMSHYGAREFGAAASYLKEAADADPKNLELLMDLAHCYLWTKQLDATIEVYRRILLINPDSAEADMIAGEALDAKGDNAGAVRQFQAAEKANPKEPNVHFGLAYLLWVQKRFDEATPEFEAELANDPKNSQALLYLGDTYVRQTQYEKARGVLEQSGKYDPSPALVHLDLGIVYMETGANDAAVRELKKAAEIEPDNVAAHFRLAGLYRGMGKKDEAKAEFDKSKTLNKKTDQGVFRRIMEANARHDADAAKDAGGRPTPPVDQPLDQPNQ
jgi:tetratricopeptide (TPR) repeat protein